MRPPRLAEASHQRLVRGFEKNYLRVDCPFYLLQDLWQSSECLALANVDDQSGTLDFRRLPCEVREARNQFEREVIDAVVTQIFESFENGALARAAHPGDDHELGWATLKLPSARRQTPTRSLLLVSVLGLFRTRGHEKMLAGAHGASINSILPSFFRCNTFTCPSGSRKTKTSRSRNSASFTASSIVMGRNATESADFATCVSVRRATAGNEWTTTGTAVAGLAPTAMCWASCLAISLGQSSLRGWRFFVLQRLLYFTAWRSILS